MSRMIQTLYPCRKLATKNAPKSNMGDFGLCYAVALNRTQKNALRFSISLCERFIAAWRIECRNRGDADERGYRL